MRNCRSHFLVLVWRLCLLIGLLSSGCSGGAETAGGPGAGTTTHGLVADGGLVVTNAPPTLILNDSGVHDDDDVFLLLIGADADNLQKSLCLSQPTAGTYEMTEFDNTPATVLPRVNNGDVDRDGEPGSGSQRYSIRLSDMQPVVDNVTRKPILHTYTFECPTTNLYHSIGFLSFGAAIQAGVYGAAIPDPDVPGSIPNVNLFLQDKPTDPGAPYTNKGTDAHKGLVQGATCAFNRGVFVGDWEHAKFYQSDTCNQYSKILHRHALDDRIYALPYDDTFVPQSANPEFSQKISNVNNVRYTIEPFKSPSAHADSPRASTSGLPAAG